MERFVWEETMDERGRAHKQAMQSPLPGYDELHAFLDALRSGKLDDRLNCAKSAALTRFTRSWRCHGGSTSPEGDAKENRRRRSSPLMALAAEASLKMSGGWPQRLPTR
jgi:hypothetical protein